MGRARPRGAGHYLGVLGKRAGWLEVMRAYVRQKADMTVAQAGIGRDLPWLLFQAGCTITEVIGNRYVERGAPLVRLGRPLCPGVWCDCEYGIAVWGA